MPELPSSRDAEVRSQAIAWYARLASGAANDADRQAWQRWHDAHPDHQRAWQPFDAMRAAFDGVPRHVARAALDAASAARRGRRRALYGMAGLAGAGSLAALGWRGAHSDGGWRGLLAEGWGVDYRTGAGEQRAVVLADQSRLLLNTRTTVDVVMNASERLVVLHGGEILVQTAPDGQHPPARPFGVQTPQGRVQALGTRFTVRSDHARTMVNVLEHAVTLRPHDAPAQTLRLQTGQQASFTRQRIAAPQPASSLYSDWANGHLVVHDWRLADVVGELARYRPGRLGCDAAVADIRVSGVFPVHDTDRALAVLTHAFAVRVVRLTRYWVSVVAA